MFRPGHTIHANKSACRVRRVNEGSASGSSGGARVWGDRSSSGIDVKAVGSGSSDDGNGRQDGPVIEGTSLALFHIGRQSRYIWSARSQGWGGVPPWSTGGRGSQQTTSCHSSGIGTVEYTFIQNRFHPLTLSSKHDFIQ